MAQHSAFGRVKRLGLALAAIHSGACWAAGAVDDNYVIDPASGSSHLVVVYNDQIYVDNAEAAKQARITSVSSLSDPTAGSVSIDTDDQLSVNFIPNPSFTGTTSFQYTLQDLRGSSTATVVLQLTSSGSALQAVDDLYQTNGEEVTLFPLENDRLAEQGDPTVTITDPAAGAVRSTSTPGLFVYTPPQDLTTSASVTMNYTVSYADGSSTSAQVTVLVDPAGAPLLSGITNPEQRQLANVLQVACDANFAGAHESRFADTCNALSALGNAERSEALEQILLRQVGAQTNSVVELTHTQVDTIARRLDDLRRGNRGLSLSGLNAVVDGQHLALGDLVQSAPSGGSAGEDDYAGGRLGVFVSGSVVLGDKDGTDLESGYEYDSQQLSVGADYRLTDQLVLGLATGIASSESDASFGDTELETDAWNLTFYGNYYPLDNWYVDGLLSYGTSDIDTRRRIRFTGVDSRSDGQIDGTQWTAAVNTGLQFNYQGWQFDTFVGAEHLRVELDAYRERNDAGLDLDVSEQNIETLRANLGARVNHAFSLQSGVLIPQLEAKWVTDIKDSDREVEARLAIVPEAGSFRVRNESNDNSYLDLGLSLTGVFTQGISGYLRYGTELAREDFSVNTWEAGGRMEFGPDLPAFPGLGGSEQQGIGVGVMAGTLGAGVSLTLPVYQDTWNLRGIASSVPYDTDQDLDDIRYDLELDVAAFGLLVDWHPFANGFRVSSGLFSNRTDVTGEARPLQPVEIGNTTFQPEEVGVLHGKIDYERSASPYVGIGWGNAVQLDSPLSFSFDLGVMFTDTPELSLDADSPLADANPALKALLLQELAEEERKVNEDDLKDVKYWPVLSLGLAYHF